METVSHQCRLGKTSFGNKPLIRYYEKDYFLNLVALLYCLTALDREILDSNLAKKAFELQSV